MLLGCMGLVQYHSSGGEGMMQDPVFGSRLSTCSLRLLTSTFYDTHLLHLATYLHFYIHLL